MRGDRPEKKAGGERDDAGFEDKEVSSLPVAPGEVEI